MEEHYKKQNKKKGSFKIFLWILIAVLLIAVIYTAFAVRTQLTGAATAITKAPISQASSYGGMVGGC